MNTEKIDGSVVKKLKALQPKGLPKHLQEYDAVKRAGDFDVNRYFDVLKHLSMRPGYVLDYCYMFSSHAGSPCLYARPVDAPPIRTASELMGWTDEFDLISEQAFGNAQDEKEPLLHYLVADGTPQSFFELLVLEHLAAQFYLYWHAFYNDTRILVSCEDIEALIKKSGKQHSDICFTEDDIRALRQIDPTPIAQIGENTADVTYCVFSKWGGLKKIKQTTGLTPPYDPNEGVLVEAVEYNCGMLY